MDVSHSHGRIATMVQREEAFRVTIDSNLLDPEGQQSLATASKNLSIEIAVVTVSERESGHPLPDYGRPITEVFVLDESQLGQAALGSAGTVDLMESILVIIANGSFPKPGERDQLTEGQRRQLRDAMILEAHSRHGRDIFVTKDKRGFVHHGRRAKLEQLCSTRILTPDEFADLCHERRNRA